MSRNCLQYFLCQDVIRRFMKNQWRDRCTLETARKVLCLKPDDDFNHAILIITLVVLLLAQIPLYPLLAIYPPLERQFERSPYFLLGSPAVKFVVSFSCDVAFGAVLTFTPRERLETWSFWLLLWVVASVLWELKQLIKGGKWKHQGLQKV